MNIDRVKQLHEDKLMELPNVIGVGIGEKDGHPIIKVFVTRKVEISSLKQGEVVPKRLSGFDVEVEEIGNLVAGGQ
ncbi:MAG: hypothetical protein AB7P14_01735 [Blastocatellales bacterium]